MDEAERDGEILDDEINPELLKQNEFERRARTILQEAKSKSESQPNSDQPLPDSRPKLKAQQTNPGPSNSGSA